MELPEIDAERLHAILDRAEDLHERGLMDRATWLQLNREFGEVTHGRLEMPGVLGRSGKHEWFEALESGDDSEQVA